MDRSARSHPPVLTRDQQRHLWKLSIAIVVMAAAVGGASSFLLPKTYTARTLIEYRLSDEDNARRAPEGTIPRAFATETALLQSRAVLGPVAESHGLHPDRLAGQVRVELLADSSVIQVDVLSGDQPLSVKLAGDIADRYLALVYERSPRKYVDEQLGAAQRQRVAALQGRKDILNLTGEHAAVVEPARLVPAATSPKPAGTAAIGLIGGLLTAAGVAWIVAARYRRRNAYPGYRRPAP